MGTKNRGAMGAPVFLIECPDVIGYSGGVLRHRYVPLAPDCTGCACRACFGRRRGRGWEARSAASGNYHHGASEGAAGSEADAWVGAAAAAGSAAWVGARSITWIDCSDTVW